MRLKVPPAINQFTKTIDKNQATTLFKLLNKYKPEDKKQKKERLQKEAEQKAAFNALVELGMLEGAHSQDNDL